MACKYTYKGITYNSKEEFISQVINSQFLGKTTSVNITVDKTKNWGQLSSLPVYGSQGVMTMRKQGTFEHFGNPFTGSGISGLIQKPNIASAVQSYINWIKGDFSEIPESKKEQLKKQRNWIIEQINSGKLDNATFLYMDKKVGGSFYYSHADALADLVKEKRQKDNSSKPTKTRRILELQSDLFQKGRDKQLLVPINEKVALDHMMGNTSQEMKDLLNSNNFLQLLNKDNNWVTFFVKSIIQDSAKKGYEKVLFPTGKTIEKIEGFNRITEELEKINNNINKYKQLIEDKQGENISNDVAKLDELDKQKQHFLAAQKDTLSTINFYENNVTNILKKQGYNPVLITDEYGNTWNEITINQVRDLENILLQKDEVNRIIGQANIKAMTVLIDSVNQKQDTLPHEYAHHYIAWFRDTPIVKEAIKKWGSEEALVQSIGEQAVNQKGDAWNWWKKFVDWILDKFDKLSILEKEDLTKILTSAFLQRVNLENLNENLSSDKIQEIVNSLPSGTYNQQESIKPGVKELFESNKKKMEGIDYVFSQSPELASIGSKAQYIQYLSTIFPNSKVRDIVYHSRFNVNNITNKDRWRNGFYSGTKDQADLMADMAESSNDLMTTSALLINMQNPKVTTYTDRKVEDYKNTNDGFIIEATEKDALQLINGRDGYNVDNFKKEYVVFEQEQIHVLGGKQDIEGFEQYLTLNINSEIQKNDGNLQQTLEDFYSSLNQDQLSKIPSIEQVKEEILESIYDDSDIIEMLKCKI